MQSKASAVWQGGLKDGSGQVSTASGVLSNTPYDFKMRFEGAKGTTPEEMIAAAHAGCFAMAFSAQLGEAKITPKKITPVKMPEPIPDPEPAEKITKKPEAEKKVLIRKPGRKKASK